MSGLVRVLRADGTTEIFGNCQQGQTTTAMRRFVLDRMSDVSGISGIGCVAEGIVFSDGTVVIRWTAALTSTAIYDSMDDLVAIHGHEGSTVVRWIDGGD
jgi:hypothetical protein